MAETYRSRTYRRRSSLPHGFEDRAPHRRRNASSQLTGWFGLPLDL